MTDKMPVAYKLSRHRNKNTPGYQKQRQKDKVRYNESNRSYPPKRWTEWEDDLVLNSPKSDHDLSDLLQRSVSSIAKRRWRLVHVYGRKIGVVKQSQKIPEVNYVLNEFKYGNWQPWEEEMILEHRQTDREMSAILCRSPHAIRVRRRILRNRPN